MSIHQTFPANQREIEDSGELVRRYEARRMEGEDGSVLSLRNARIADAFTAWLREDGDRLVEAAELLGGPEWAARARDVLSDVVAGALPADRLAELRALRRLLRLELVDDLASAEAAFFAAVDPDDPRADAARLCAEALDRGVAALVALRGSAASFFEEAA